MQEVVLTIIVIMMSVLSPLMLLLIGLFAAVPTIANKLVGRLSKPVGIAIIAITSVGMILLYGCMDNMPIRIVCAIVAALLSAYMLFFYIKFKSVNYCLKLNLICILVLTALYIVPIIIYRIFYKILVYGF